MGNKTADKLELLIEDAQCIGLDILVDRADNTISRLEKELEDVRAKRTQLNQIRTTIGQESVTDSTPAIKSQSVGKTDRTSILARELGQKLEDIGIKGTDEDEEEFGDEDTDEDEEEKPLLSQPTSWEELGRILCYGKDHRAL